MLRVSDLVRITFRQQIRQRNFGVILSIASGICIYLVVTILGNEIQNRIGQDINLIGGVSLIRATFEEHHFPGSPPQSFSPRVVDLLRRMPNVLSASVSMRRVCFVPMLLGDKAFDLFVLGVDRWFWQTNSIIASQGRLLNADDEARQRRVCVLGEDIARVFFGNGPYIGRIVTMHNDNYEVVGIGSGVMMRERSYWCFIPLGTAIARGLFDAAPNRLQLHMAHLDDVETMSRALPSIVAGEQQAAHLKVEYSVEELEKVRNIIGGVRILLALGIVGSLVLGGLGIWQGTFSAVRERTREVGLKLAMGAERRDILSQFLAEALLKSLLGGTLGVIFGIAAIQAGSVYIGIVFSWTELMQTAVSGLCAATLVGVLGGVYPALCASRMDVVQALRFE